MSGQRRHGAIFVSSVDTDSSVLPIRQLRKQVAQGRRATWLRKMINVGDHRCTLPRKLPGASTELEDSEKSGKPPQVSNMEDSEKSGKPQQVSNMWQRAK